MIAYTFLYRFEFLHVECQVSTIKQKKVCACIDRWIESNDCRKHETIQNCTASQPFIVAENEYSPMHGIRVAVLSSFQILIEKVSKSTHNRATLN